MDNIAIKPAKLRPQRREYVIVYYWDGKRERESFSLTKRKEAKDRLIVINNLLSKNIFPKNNHPFVVKSATPSAVKNSKGCIDSGLCIGNGAKPAELRTQKREYLIVYYWDGRRQRESFALTKRKKAEGRLIMINKLLEKGVCPKGRYCAPVVSRGNSGFDKVGSMTVAKGVSIGLRVMTFNGSNRGAKSNVDRFLKWLRDYGYDCLELDDFDNYFVFEYLDYLRTCISDVTGRCLSKRTLYNHRGALLRVWSIMRERGYISSNVWKESKPVKLHRKPKRALRDSEIIKIDKWLDSERSTPNFRIVLYFLYFCLFRPVELTRLRVHHIDLCNGVIFMPDGVIVKKSGGDKGKRIFKPLLDLLKVYLKGAPPHCYVFGGKKGFDFGVNKISSGRFSYWFRKCKKDTGIDVDMYQIKNNGVGDMRRKGVDSCDIAAQACWNDVNTINSYSTKLIMSDVVGFDHWRGNGGS